jgi:hypothetical protein
MWRVWALGVCLGVSAAAWAVAPDQRDFMYDGATYRMVVFDPARGPISPRVVLAPALTPVGELMGPDRPIAAITGTFFAWETGQPVGEVVVNGDVLTEGARGSVLAVDWLGRVSIFDVPVREWTDYFPYRFALRATIRDLGIKVSVTAACGDRRLAPALARPPAASWSWRLPATTSP